MPGYRVTAISFISPTHGYGLLEFDSTGNSTAEQLVSSEDGGVTWTVAATTPLPEWASVLDFSDTADGYAWGGEGLDVTHDGGHHWVSSMTTETGWQSVSPVGDNVWAVSQLGVLEVSADGGVTWHEAVQPPGGVSGLSRVDVTVAYALQCGQLHADGTQSGNLARTEDGGTTWTVTPLPQGCTGQADWSDLVAVSTEDLWLVEFGQPATDMSSKWVYRSMDGGRHWTLAAESALNNRHDLGQISPLGDVGPLTVVAATPDRAWLAEDRGGLLVTNDGGTFWTPAYSDASTADAFGPPVISFLDSTHGWSASGYGLWRTTNGTTWDDIAPAPSGR